MLKLGTAALMLLLALPAVATTVHSLGEVPAHLRTPEARHFFAVEMQGKPAPDGLGTHLPPVLSAATIRGLLLPGRRAVPTLIGAEPWQVRPDLYVAIVCTGGAVGDAGEGPRCAGPGSGEKGLSPKAYLGVIAAKHGAPPKLLAVGGPIDGAVSWRDSGLPRQPMAADGAHGAPIAPDKVVRFDLAPYKIAPHAPAFGLRVAWRESYAGGGAYFTGLVLFAIEGRKLRQVLAVPMSAYSDIAGDWHKNGTRDHDITDAANILIVSRHLTDGHFDLIIKQRHARWHRIFRWSAASDGYHGAHD